MTKKTLTSLPGFVPEQGRTLEGIQNILRQNLFILLFVFLGIVFLFAGIVSLFTNSRDARKDIIFEEGRPTITAEKIKVDIEGAVVYPGVYELGPEARIQELLISAGGFTSSANREWAAKNLNLAAKLTDGAKIYVPQQGDAVQVSNSETMGNLSEEKININNASLGVLDKLPGIGLVTAQKIIDGRPYQIIDDLRDKKVVSNSVFEKIKDQITVW
ncbi:ComEA family DNA-binding protein [Candidatus Microgenomates bacterium]|nr:ComEA family DNA-binding protein [Candidatus Microgenomates bacterium]